MLRPVLIGLVLVNGVLLAAHWGGASQWLSGGGPRQHEPERLQRQVHPEWLRITPTGAARGGADHPASAPATAPASTPARSSGLSPRSATGTLAGLSTAAPGSMPRAPARVCLEAGPLDAAALAVVQRLLREAGVPDRSWQTSTAPAAPRHVILMGRYADPEHLRRKTGELQRKGVKFVELRESPDIPAKYLPGLVLGRYAEPAAAETALAALRERGVISAKLVVADARAPGTLLRVAAPADDGLRARTTALALPAGQHWHDCSATQGGAASAGLSAATATA